MTLIAWDESLSVNIAEFDRQHQKLITMIDELSDAMKQGNEEVAVGKIVSGLISYTETHFKAEEKYFVEFGYPDAESHIKEHMAFIEKISEFIDEFDTGNLSLPSEILTFLSDWSKKHIRKTDKKYSRFFNERGVARQSVNSVSWYNSITWHYCKESFITSSIYSSTLPKKYRYKL